MLKKFADKNSDDELSDYDVAEADLYPTNKNN